MRTVSLHISWVLKQSGTSLDCHGSYSAALMPILWVLKRSATYTNGYAPMPTASSCTSWTPGIYFSMCNMTVHVPSIVLSMIYQNTFINKSLILFNPPWPGQDKTHKFIQGRQFFLCTQKNPLNHFHNAHFQVHCQDLNCSLYAQPLKLVQEN